MDKMEETCVKCAAQGFFLAKNTNNNESLFVEGISKSLHLYPDDVKKILKDAKKRWSKKKTTKRRK